MCSTSISLKQRVWTSDKALKDLKERVGWYDPEILDVLEEILQVTGTEQIKLVKIKDLEIDMVLTEDIVSESGIC